MQAGVLRQRVTIQSRAGGVDGFGAPNGDWTDVATIWAAVQPLRGQERMQAQQTQSDIDHKVITRYRADLTPATRLLYGTRVLDIDSVINVDERNEKLEILCKEAV